ncbi:MAG: hypothetical protein MJ025_04535 [Victivallaceae bacterium]|nr:hypothetical protein [Victivallaceae bacterium]
MATGLTSLGTGTITINGETATGGSVVVDDKSYVVRLSGNNLVIVSAVGAGIITPSGTNTLEIDGIIYTGASFTSMEDAFGTYSVAAVQGCTFSTQSTIGLDKTAVIDQTEFNGSSVSGNGGALCNDGSALVSASTFSANTASAGGAFYNTGIAILRDSTFATSTDTVRNTGTMTIGGTVRTAANISSDTAITVEQGTELVLNLAVYEGTTSRELLTGFDAMLGMSQADLTMSIDVSDNQAQGTYVLATGISSLAQQEFAIAIDGDFQSSLVVAIGEKALHGNKLYILDLADETLSLDITSFRWENCPVISVLAGTPKSDDRCITGLKLLDVKAAGTYEGAIIETQAGKANVKIANNGEVDILEFRQHANGSQTTIAMKKNAKLVVSGPNGMSGIAKLTTGDNSIVRVSKDIVGTMANDSLTIGKANGGTIGGKLDFGAGKNTLKIGANSTVSIDGGVFGVQSFALTAGAKDKEKKQQRTIFTAGNIIGTDNKDKITLGNFSTLTAASIDLKDGESALTAGGAGSKLVVTGEVSGINAFKTGNGKDTSEDGAVAVDIGKLSLDSAKKNTLSIGKFGSATIHQANIEAKATVTIGANADVDMHGANLDNINKLTITAGAKYKDGSGQQTQGITTFEANTATGPDANVAFKVGGYAYVTFGDIDFMKGKDTLNIGGKGVLFEAKDVKNVATLKVAAGKSAAEAEMAKVTINGNISFDQVSNKLDIGAYSKFLADDITATLDDPKTKMVVNIGSAGTVSLRSIDHVSSLKVAAGKQNKTTGDIDMTDFGANVIKGTDYNDTFAFGNDVTAEFGTIDMGGDDDKDKLTIGKGSLVETGVIRNVEQISLGDNSALNVISFCDLKNCKITGSAGGNTLLFGQDTHVGEVDLGKGENAIGFLLHGTDVTLDTRCVIDKYSGDDKLYINTTVYEGTAGYIGDGREALLEQKNGGLWLTVRMK